MRIWLVGKSGMLANSFEKVLAARNLDYFVTGECQVDICDRKAVFAVDDFTHIINCAAYTAVDKAEEEIELAFEVNRDGARNLAEAAKKRGAKLVHFSTDYVFDGQKGAPYVEEDLTNPLSVYGKSKLAGEEAVLGVSDKNLLIRSSWLFGEGRGNFVKTMVRLLQEKERLQVVGDQIGRPTFCGDLAQATLDLLKCEGVFHFANEGELSWCDFAREIASCLPKARLHCREIESISTEDFGALAPRPRYSVLSTEKARSLTEAQNWKTGLSSYVYKLIQG